MWNYQAPATRSDPSVLKEEIQVLERSPVIEALLDSVAGLLAIVDQNRQILSVNDQLLRQFGIEDHADLLGLRPGEAFHCKYADQKREGCGHSDHCSTCGLALSIVLSESGDKPVERICALEIKHGTHESHLALKVRSVPIRLESQRFYLIFLQDITQRQFWLSMEKVFIHDLNNIISVMLGQVELMEVRHPHIEKKSIEHLQIMVNRIKQEVDLQRSLISDLDAHWHIEWRDISLQRVMSDLSSIFEENPLARGRILDIREPAPLNLYCDYAIVMRILCNMVINALEATDMSAFIRVWVETTPDQVHFHVWNEGFIDSDIQKRIFQKHFSSKNDEGRGLGTYSMKLLGERLLKGKVSFVSDPESGTTFTFSLPLLEKNQ